MNYGQAPQPTDHRSTAFKAVMQPTPTLRQIAERLAAQLADRAPPPPPPPAPTELAAQVVEKPYEEEASEYEGAVLAQAKERGLKGTAYALEQRAQQESLKKRVLQFYCKHRFVNVPIQWYGATAYPRICASCGKVQEGA